VPWRLVAKHTAGVLRSAAGDQDPGAIVEEAQPLQEQSVYAVEI